MSLYRNIHAKRKRIKAGSGEKMRKVGQKGAPTAKNFKQAKRKKRGNVSLQRFLKQKVVCQRNMFAVPRTQRSVRQRSSVLPNCIGKAS